MSAGNADAEIVHFKFGAASLDLSQYRTYQITKNGVECSIGDLKEWDVLSIADYEDVAEIVVTSRALSGTLQEISDRCGFHSVNYFSRRFRRLYGCTPGRARLLGK